MQDLMTLRACRFHALHALLTGLGDPALWSPRRPRPDRRWWRR